MKKNIIIYKVLFLLSIFILSGCKENEMIQYEDGAALYFANEQYGQKDSISHSFFILDTKIMRDTVYVKINTMGALSDQDRPIHIVQTNIGKEDAAIAGVHYVAFNDEEMKKHMIIPAGRATQSIPVIFLRDQSLDLQEVRLELKVAQNDYFRPGIDDFRTFLVTTTAQAVKPGNWDTMWRYYFGATWGSVKMKFIIEATGYTDWGTAPADIAYVGHMKALVQQRFLEYNEANPDNPLREADGNLVTF